MTAQNIILQKDKSDEITVYTTSVQEIQNKTLIPIQTPTTSANWTNGPKTPKLLDLLRVIQRFNVDGRIESSDRDKFRNLITKGGTFTLDYNDEQFIVSYEKFTITQRPEDDTANAQPGEYDVKFSVIVGEDF